MCLVFLSAWNGCLTFWPSQLPYRQFPLASMGVYSWSKNKIAVAEHRTSVDHSENSVEDGLIFRMDESFTFWPLQ
jgi:hypothetical protein